MDRKLRNLERQVRQGDASAALQYEQQRRRLEGPREYIRPPIYPVAIDTRRVQGKLELTINSNQEIEFDNWKVLVSYEGGPPGSGGQEDILLYVNGIPHSIQFTYHNFEEYGWQPTSLARLQESQQKREEQHRSWGLGTYLHGGYEAHPNIYIRRTDRPFNRGDPTSNARDRILELGKELAETWPLEHPEEARLAHKIFLNNEIITAQEAMDVLQGQYYEATNHLASLIAADLD